MYYTGSRSSCILCIFSHYKSKKAYAAKIRALPEFLLPFSYSHLLLSPTLDPFPAKGVGVLGVSGKVIFALDPAGPSGLGEP